MAIFTGTTKQLGGGEKDKLKQQFFYGLVQKNVLVTGAHGQLGSELKKLSEQVSLPFRFFFTDADSLDITDIDQVDAFVTHHAVLYIINCAGYTAVDKAETEPEKVFAVNATAVENLALVARERGVKLIHVSTDFVFDGNARVPYREEDVVRPLSVYGKSKAEGEKLLREVGGDWIILRTSWLYSKFANNFVKTMIRLMNERESLAVVNDQRGTPTYAADLAEMIVHILQTAEDQQEWKTGIYHFSNRGETTWFDFAREIQRVAGIEGCELLPVSTEAYGAPASRPAYSVMDLSKIQSAFQVEIPAWEEALRRCMRQLKMNN